MRTKFFGTALCALSLLGFGDKAEASYRQGPYSVEVIMNGASQPIVMSGGQGFVAGEFGAAYQIRVANDSGRRIEAVVAVDGRDVITGQPIRPGRHRGHLVQAGSSTTIAGFRSSSSTIATFRFSTIPRSYAWRTGTHWGIGTIRVWVYQEAAPVIPEYYVVPYGEPYPRPAPERKSRAHGGAPSMSESAPSAPRDMGTEYGEQRWSPVTRTAFHRAGGASAVLGIRYQSVEALMAAGILHPAWERQVYVYGPDYYDYCVGCEWPYPYAPPPPGYPY